MGEWHTKGCSTREKIGDKVTPVSQTLERNTHVSMETRADSPWQADTLRDVAGSSYSRLDGSGSSCVFTFIHLRVFPSTQLIWLTRILHSLHVQMTKNARFQSQPSPTWQMFMLVKSDTKLCRGSAASATLHGFTLTAACLFIHVTTS